MQQQFYRALFYKLYSPFCVRRHTSFLNFLASRPKTASSFTRYSQVLFSEPLLSALLSCSLLRGCWCKLAHTSCSSLYGRSRAQ